MDFFDGASSTGNTSGATTPTTSSPATSLPSRSDIKTQKQLMDESIKAIEDRGAQKYEQLQAELKKRTADHDAKIAEEEDKMKAGAAAELKQHVAARDQAVAAAKKTHAEAQSQLLKEQKSLEKKQGALWELAATHSDLSKPNPRAQKSTDRMRKMMGSLATEPNVPIGEGSE